ncbi:serine threonine protein phosphatase [Stylonychia lemnae]|uniref:protein-serine/threonine phosphatase n=1 Tax=Stylonychia lemnae TaxID=5949 RepID=A0A078AI02_STYLE|nr:serine threonine protein phosphatase [Stylonychia lemnae]|eukprot:CDW80413.1 serine threonine protein phosphatase [Stylonychia lemnae]
MSNVSQTTEQTQQQNQKIKTFLEEEKIHKINAILHNHRSQDHKHQHQHSDYISSQKQKHISNIENMKSSSTTQTVLRPQSNEKIGGNSQLTVIGNGSLSFNGAITRKPNLKLNTNLINQTSIGIPQTTQNLHSSRMINYQNPHSQVTGGNQNQQNNNSSQFTHRTGLTASTPKNTTSTNALNGTANYSSSLLLQAKHRSQLSNSQLNQGTQGSQGAQLSSSTASSSYANRLIQNINNINSNSQIQNNDINSNKLINQHQHQQQQMQSNSSAELVKVGTQIPKTTTAANLRNFNNLRQFNQLFNNNKGHHQSSKSKGNESDFNHHNINLTPDQNNQSVLQNHQKHLQQQNSKSNLNQHQQTLQQQRSMAKAIQEAEKQSLLKIKPKNLQISIPSSPRNEIPKVQAEEKSEQDKTIIQNPQLQAKANNIHSGSLSTTNANQGNIKLSKFTCHSTRNNAQKQNMFSQQKKTPDLDNLTEESKDAKSQSTSDNPDFMPLQPAHKIIIPNHESTKHSVKRNGVVRAYAANTNQGLVRNYNEDRVSIILNILKPPNRKDENWPRCSFFGIYDGHGGSACADFLRDNLHQFVIKEQSFPSDPKEAIRIGFANAEKKFLELCQNESGVIDKSGSCAIVALIVEDNCYIANVGDSRAILSSRTATTNPDQNNPNKKEIVVGPLRVLPGRLSVSRTFGDAEAKLLKTGGNPKVVIADPEIKSFKISNEHDFVILGCDGIFDKLNNQDTMACVWNSVNDNKTLGFAQNIHKQSGMAVEYILKNSLLRRTLDNVTVVMIAFNNFKHSVFGTGKHSGKNKNKKGTMSKQSNDSSLVLQPPVSRNGQDKRKENIPPSSSSSQIDNLNGKRSGLGISTNSNCTSQGPKTTTNAQLQKDTMLKEGNQQNQSSLQNTSSSLHPKKGINAGYTSNNTKSKHFDFSNV